VKNFNDLPSVIKSALCATVLLGVFSLLTPTPVSASVIPKASERECKKFLSRGDQLFASNAFHGSLSFYQQAVTADPSNYEAHLKLGTALARLNSNEEALKELFQSLMLNADHPETNLTARAEIAAILMKQGNYDEAGGQLKQVLDLSPGDLVVRGNYALCLEHLGYVDASIEQLKLIVKANSFDVVALYNLGTAYLRKGQGDIAKKYFDRVVSIDSKHLLGYLGIANSLMLQGNNPEALKYCQIAVKLGPENHYAFLALGDVYEKLDQKGKAIEAYKRAIQINPRDNASRAAMAKLLQTSKQLANTGQIHASQ
jgi:tetratricopeptide (TPR) repeat protein